jgi:predicted amidohydrolase YtcJ
MKATQVMANGRVHTQDPARPSATAIAVSGEKILAVGDDDEMKAMLAPGGEWLDLAGRRVVPGLVDAHVHLQMYSLGLQEVKLEGAADLGQALELVAARAAVTPPGEWILGQGWNQDEWPDKGFPAAADLDRVAPDHPVYLKDKSTHAGWANRRALRLAGLGRDTPDPPGGKFQRDAHGELTGILFEDATDLLSMHIPRPTGHKLASAIGNAQGRLAAGGLTGVHDFDGRECFAALQALRAEDHLTIRVVKNIRANRLEHAIGVGLRSGFGDDWLRIGGIKIFADGALGPRTAAMIAPYEGEPDNTGIVTTEKEELMALAMQATAHGLSLTIHAIGDRANHDVLDVLEELRRAEFQEPAGPQGGTGRGERRLRHRIEHVQLLHPSDLGRLAALDVIASMQPIHATSDMHKADRYWGERARTSYAWRSLLRAGTTLAFGSDAPVEAVEPLTGLHAAVTRRRPDGTPGLEGWYPAERLTLAEAIWAYTMGAAIAGGRESLTGSIQAGKLADLTIFDRDIFAIPPDELLETKVDGTVVGGRFVHRTW